MAGEGRDFVGYGERPPDPKWPGGARLAVTFALNYEEGSEFSFADGDGVSEDRLTEMSAAGAPPGVRNLAAETMFEYGSRAGFWRVRRLFRERGLPYTMFACSLALERNPEAARVVREDGVDVCCHGWRWVEVLAMPEEEEREHIRLGVESLERTIGRRPLGWYHRYAPSPNTRRLLVEEGGFLYDSDAYNDDLPYWVRVAGTPHLVVPYTLTNNDAKFGAGIGTGAEFYEYLRDGIDFLREEGRKETPRMMSIGLHPRLVGQPARAAGLARVLDHLAACDDVWVCARLDIAKHWRAVHPAPEGSA